MIESTGGAGLDYEAFDDKLKFSLEAWDFSREKDEPHLKFATTFFFYDNLFVTAGVDDILSPDYRSVFAGAGLMFADDDVKYLMGKVPGL